MIPIAKQRKSNLQIIDKNDQLFRHDLIPQNFDFEELFKHKRYMTIAEKKTKKRTDYLGIKRREEQLGYSIMNADRFAKSAIRRPSTPDSLAGSRKPQHSFRKFKHAFKATRRNTINMNPRQIALREHKTVLEFTETSEMLHRRNSKMIAKQALEFDARIEQKRSVRFLKPRIVKSQVSSERKKSMAYGELCKLARKEIITERERLKQAFQQQTIAAKKIQTLFRKFRANAIFETIKLKQKQELERKVRKSIIILQAHYRGAKSRKEVQFHNVKNKYTRLQRHIRTLLLLKRAQKSEEERSEEERKIRDKAKKKRDAWLSKLNERSEQERNQLIEAIQTSKHCDSYSDRIVPVAKMSHKNRLQEEERQITSVLCTDTKVPDEEDLQLWIERPEITLLSFKMKKPKVEKEVQHIPVPKLAEIVAEVQQPCSPVKEHRSREEFLRQEILKAELMTEFAALRAKHHKNFES